MKSISAFLSLIPLVPLFAAGPATAQSPQPQAASTAPVAYVYVGTSKGVELYNAAVNGQLSLVHGSPFPITGMAAGSNGKYFVSLGTYLLHTYAVSSTGTIGAQVSQIDTQDYYGNGNCEGVKQGTEGLANLDHTGQNLYVAFPSLDGGCDESIQSYDISKSGDLSFVGGIMTGSNTDGGFYQMPSITSGDNFAYAAGSFDCCGLPPSWIGYTRKSTGELENLSFKFTTNTAASQYVPYYVTADPSNHLAAIVALNYGEGQYDPAQLASFTVDSSGNLSSTGTAANMPTPSVNPYVLNMAPSGKLLAVGGSNGLEVYHFNGASPITSYSKVLTPSNIDILHWDNNNHLYALSEAQSTVYLTWSATDATNVTIKGSDGSTYSVGNCSGECQGDSIVYPTKTTTYTISGTPVSGSKASASTTVTVHTAPAGSAAVAAEPNATSSTMSISASPNSINTFSQLFVYTVTPTSIAAVPGSPYTITTPGVNALFVVPKL